MVPDRESLSVVNKYLSVQQKHDTETNRREEILKYFVVIYTSSKNFSFLISHITSLMVLQTCLLLHCQRIDGIERKINLSKSRSGDYLCHLAAVCTDF